MAFVALGVDGAVGGSVQGVEKGRIDNRQRTRQENTPPCMAVNYRLFLFTIILRIDVFLLVNGMMW